MSIVLTENDYWSESFSQLDLSRVIWKDKIFEACHFKECNFSDAKISQCKFIDCEFTQCNLSMVKLKYSEFNDVVFKESKLNGIDWTITSLSNLTCSTQFKFDRCMLNDSTFFAMQLAGLVAVNCKIRRVDFRDGDFSKANFTGSELSGSLFNNTNLTAANFTDAIEYDIDINFNSLKDAKFSRVEAIRLLTHLGITLVD